MDTSWAHCAWAPGEDLSGPHVHRPQSPLLNSPLQGLGTRTCPVKRGAWVGGLVGPFSDGHTQVWGSVRWPVATRRGHHAAAAPFWGLRCPRGGWGRGEVAVTGTCGTGVLGPGSSLRRSGRHAQRGGDR